MSESSIDIIDVDVDSSMYEYVEIWYSHSVYYNFDILLVEYKYKDNIHCIAILGAMRVTTVLILALLCPNS